MPYIINQKVWIANANIKLTTKNYHYIASFWEPSSRMGIVSVLSTNDSTTINDMIKLQNDSYSSFVIYYHILEIINNQ